MSNRNSVATNLLNVSVKNSVRNVDIPSSSSEKNCVFIRIEVSTIISEHAGTDGIHLSRVRPTMGVVPSWFLTGDLTIVKMEGILVVRLVSGAIRDIAPDSTPCLIANSVNNRDSVAWVDVGINSASLSDIHSVLLSDLEVALGISRKRNRQRLRVLFSDLKVALGISRNRIVLLSDSNSALDTNCRDVLHVDRNIAHLLDRHRLN